MNRREHSHRIVCTMQVTFSRNVYRQSLVRTISSLAGQGVQQTLPPTFLFLQYSVFKEQTPQTRYRGPLRFWLRGRSSVAHAALLNYSEGSLRSELLRRQRRAALVGEAYIVGGPPKCQHRFRTFLNFLRQLAARRSRPCVNRPKNAFRLPNGPRRWRLAGNQKRL